MGFVSLTVARETERKCDNQKPGDQSWGFWGTQDYI